MNELSVVEAESDYGIRELSSDEIEAVGGGLRLVGNIFLGYVAGKALDYLWENGGRDLYNAYADFQTRSAHSYGEMLMERRRARGL